MERLWHRRGTSRSGRPSPRSARRSVGRMRMRQPATGLPARPVPCAPAGIICVRCVIRPFLPSNVWREEKLGHLDSQRSLPTFKSDKLGFSPLAKKLRLAAEHSVAVLNAPDGYVSQLRPGPTNITTTPQPNQTYDAVQLFVKNVDELRRLGGQAIRAVKPDGLLWITYPKGGQTRGATDLPATPGWVQRDVLGEMTSMTGYKAVAFVAIDDTWTALRFKRV